MALLDILLYPNPILRKKSVEVERIDDSVRLLLDNMTETMRAARGLGLSAPQVGESIRVVVVSDASGFSPEEKENENMEMPVIEMINPVIRSGSGRKMESEGCLSIPGLVAKVGRKESVEVEWLSRNGETSSATLTGLTARIVQHETDHLDGILFVDRLSRLKRDMMLKKMDKVFADAG